MNIFIESMTQQKHVALFSLHRFSLHFGREMQTHKQIDKIEMRLEFSPTLLMIEFWCALALAIEMTKLGKKTFCLENWDGDRDVKRFVD